MPLSGHIPCAGDLRGYANTYLSVGGLVLFNGGMIFLWVGFRGKSIKRNGTPHDIRAD